MQAKHSRSLKPTTPCRKCFGTGTEVVSGKGARACKCRRRRSDGVIDLRSYREQKARRSNQQTSADQTQLARAQREAEGVMSFFRGYAPDFITAAVIDAIYDACEVTGTEAPTYENDHQDESETLAALTALFKKTEMLSLRSRVDRSSKTPA